jgi:inhibitor of KinA
LNGLASQLLRRDKEPTGLIETTGGMERGGIMNIKEWSMEPLGDSALLITPRMDSGGLASMHAVISRLIARLEACREWLGYSEYVPAYASLALHYEPWRIFRSRTREEGAHASIFETVAARVRRVMLDSDPYNENLQPERRECVEIPVCYGGQHGPDLEEAASHAGIAPEKLIAIHSSASYLVHMIGFAPGFPYLGGMPQEIAVPRRAAPRQLVPAGSVGIGGSQTGVYPVATPGGWQLIGKTPIKLFRPDTSRPSLLQAGDIVRFKPISVEEFYDLYKFN